MFARGASPPPSAMSSLEEETCAACLDPFVDARDDDDAPVPPRAGPARASARGCPAATASTPRSRSACGASGTSASAGTEGVGRCPKCREHVRVTPRGEVLVAENRGRCELCLQQPRAERGTARALRRVRGRDEAPAPHDASGAVARSSIAHPMWRYQPSPATFGTTTWACHVSAASTPGGGSRPRASPACPSTTSPRAGASARACSALREEVRRSKEPGEATEDAADEDARGLVPGKGDPGASSSSEVAPSVRHAGEEARERGGEAARATRDRAY